MQAQAVEQLGFVGRQQVGEAGNLGGVGVAVLVGVGGLAHRLQNRHALQHAGHRFQRGRGAQAAQAQPVGGVHHRLAIGTGQCLDQREHMATVHRAEHLTHPVFAQRTAAKCNGLVGQRERVAHGAPGGPGQQTQCAGFGGYRFRLQHGAEVFQHRLRRHRPQVELKAARQHRGRHLLRVGGGEYELEVFGWLFQRLQHRVEGGVGQHVHFVDHEDLEASLHRFVDRLLQKRGNLVHTAVGSRVQLGVVDKTAAVDVGAGAANAAGLGGDAALAI